MISGHESQVIIMYKSMDVVYYRFLIVVFKLPVVL